jgi:uncharacterized protein DUF3830
VLRITLGELELTARLEEESAPRTVEVVRDLLPLEGKLVQARWSGEAAWVPLGWNMDLGLGPENATSYPAPGELLLYPGGLSEVEILFPYGATCFASKMASWRATTSRRSREAGSTWLRSGAQSSRTGHRRSSSPRSEPGIKIFGRTADGFRKAGADLTPLPEVSGSRESQP